MENENKFNSLAELTDHYTQQLIELKYQEAVDLLAMLSDEEYEQLWEDNKELMDPIQEDGGDEYLHDCNVLDTIICIFARFIKNREEKEERAKTEKVLAEIISKLKELDLENLDKVNSYLSTCQE